MTAIHFWGRDRATSYVKQRTAETAATTGTWPRFVHQGADFCTHEEQDGLCQGGAMAWPFPQSDSTPLLKREDSSLGRMLENSRGPNSKNA